ncbi:tetratricopeptide repeat protein [Clostridium psychrophilum]|uniref:tetratricopeptide repeat protein n=1 Tax=Clostridium psychrophilum TaxID=132926 RepID=UPI001C0AF81D|nr:tetratricopeptide repeat protein [Clostridium psychrophilum]MBU3180539.1 hypothetical protein [Clostridium psychrophilum]
MDKSGKVYVKAMNKYNDGYIKKAISLCEKSISLNNRNAAALNLKGILYYLEGDLDKAKNMWNINYKRNNDKVSKKYLDDSVHDKEKLHLYVRALELVKKYNINGALKLLNKCENSDFNFINVNNNITLCYIKQGEYVKALQYIKKVLKVDKNNTQAIINKKTLMEFGTLKRKINYKKIVIGIFIIILIISLFFMAKMFMYNKSFSIFGVKKFQKETSLNSKKVNIKTKNLVPIHNQEDKAVKNNNQEMNSFPREQLTESIKNNNFEQIVGYVTTWKDINLNININDRLLLVKAEDIIKSNGIQFFYKKGTTSMNNKKFSEAKKYFLYALPYSSGSYLKEHIIYMLAVSYKSTSDFQNALEYYELNLKQYPRGTYCEEVLYNLIIINKELDITKSKIYAQKLVKQFPSSQYNNLIVKEILNY